MGAAKLKELSKRTTFVRVTQQVRVEHGESPPFWAGVAPGVPACSLPPILPLLPCLSWPLVLTRRSVFVVPHPQLNPVFVSHEVRSPPAAATIAAAAAAATKSEGEARAADAQ